jgi:hypothetical protein
MNRFMKRLAMVMIIPAALSCFSCLGDLIPTCVTQPGVNGCSYNEVCNEESRWYVRADGQVFNCMGTDCVQARSEMIAWCGSRQ